MALRLSEGLGSAARDQGKVLWFTNGLDGEIYVELWPEEVVFRWALDVRKLLDRGLLEPRELAERHRKLFISEQ